MSRIREQCARGEAQGPCASVRRVHDRAFGSSGHGQARKDATCHDDDGPGLNVRGGVDQMGHGARRGRACCKLEGCSPGLLHVVFGGPSVFRPCCCLEHPFVDGSEAHARLVLAVLEDIGTQLDGAVQFVCRAAHGRFGGVRVVGAPSDGHVPPEGQNVSQRAHVAHDVLGHTVELGCVRAAPARDVESGQPLDSGADKGLELVRVLHRLHLGHEKGV